MTPKQKAPKQMAEKKATKKKTKKKATKKKAARGYHHGDLRQGLLAAARLELQETGWQGLSLRSVARRAGVTHTAAYHHFADKQALLSTIAVEGFVALDRAMAAAMDGAGDDALDRLLASGRGYLAMATDDPMAYDLMFNGCTLAGPGAVSAAPGPLGPVGHELQRVGADPFLRLCNAVAAVREPSATKESAASPGQADTLADALLFWEVVHGCAMLARSGQLALLGVDPAQHGRLVLERLRALYPSARDQASTGGRR